MTPVMLQLHHLLPALVVRQMCVLEGQWEDFLRATSAELLFKEEETGFHTSGLSIRPPDDKGLQDYKSLRQEPLPFTNHYTGQRLSRTL